MDMLTRGYTCYARLWANSDDLTLIRWYPAAPGARCFTGRHRFGTLYDSRGPSSRDVPGTPDPYRLGENPDPNPGIGEAGNGFSTAALPRQSDDRGNIHGLTGQHFCRPDLAWTGGTVGVDEPLAVDGDGIPTCCQRAEQAKGGLALGGRATEGGIAGPEVPSGGLALGGEALEAAFASEVAAGGLALGGEALEAAFASEVAAGGLALGGEALEAGLAGELPGGGLALGGEALEAGVAEELPSGGLALGGEALEAGVAEEVPSGGLALGGEALEAGVAEELPSGGLALGGEALESSSSGTVSVTCGSCTTMPKNWSLVVSGYTGSAAALNGSWTLTYSFGCVWTTGGATPVWKLSFSTSVWQLQGTSGFVNSFFNAPSAGWNCLAANTFAYAGGSGDTGHPGSLTINPE